MKFFLIVFALMTSCVTTHNVEDSDLNLSFIEDGCTAQPAQLSGTWVFIQCPVKNISTKNQKLNVAIVLDSDDEELIQPSLSETKSFLQAEASFRQGLPTGSPSSTSDRPETFLVSALISILNVTRSAPEYQNPSDLKPNESATITFALKKGFNYPPSAIRLNFKNPASKIVQLPLKVDRELENRRRANQF